jgi:hypothetical protein
MYGVHKGEIYILGGISNLIQESIGQCCGSVKFWYWSRCWSGSSDCGCGSGSGTLIQLHHSSDKKLSVPYLWPTDPDAYPDPQHRSGKFLFLFTLWGIKLKRFPRVFKKRKMGLLYNLPFLRENVTFKLKKIVQPKKAISTNFENHWGESDSRTKYESQDTGNLVTLSI